MNVADALERIADYTDKVGHFCGPSTPLGGIGLDGSLCLIRAADACCADYFDLADTLRSFVSADCLIDWSDATDHETFTATLRACAAIERAKAAQVSACPQPVEVCA